jgi:xylulose-5-phosphate/fructose-6-phosphate phosphoketolase
MNEPLSSELIQKMNAYWRAANYLSVGQIYLYDNPLLKIPLHSWSMGSWADKYGGNTPPPLVCWFPV